MFHVNARVPKGKDTLEDVDMKTPFSKGSTVRIIGIPDWLINDLPEDEKREISSFIGQEAVIEKIDQYGYIWVGFGSSTEIKNISYYSGHSFAITEEYLQIIQP